MNVKAHFSTLSRPESGMSVERLKAQRETAESVVHQLDVRCRQVISEVMQRCREGLPAGRKAALAAAANGERRALLADARKGVEGEATVAEQVNSWAVQFELYCDRLANHLYAAATGDTAAATTAAAPQQAQVVVEH